MNEKNPPRRSDVSSPLQVAFGNGLVILAGYWQFHVSIRCVFSIQAHRDGDLV